MWDFMIIKKYIDDIPLIAFYGLITFISLGISLEFLEWAINYFFWEGTLGIMYMSLNMFQKLLVLWFLGIPLYFLKKKK